LDEKLNNFARYEDRVFINNHMQLVKPIEPQRRGRSKHPVKTHHLSAFGILNRNGLEMAENITSPVKEEEKENKRAEFSEWSMPEQRPGYIQCKLHDFL
jgi:hypothetical protein